MTEYVAKTGTLDIPKGTGIDGFLKALRPVLNLPRLQEVHIEARGKVNVTYTYFAREGTVGAIDVEFESLMPYAVVRQSTVLEPPIRSSHAAVALAEVFAAAARDHAFPVAWVAGPATHFWRWYETATGIRAGGAEELHGLPVLTDRLIDDDVLLLCTAFGRHASFAETQRTYKLVVPETAGEGHGDAR